MVCAGRLGQLSHRLRDPMDLDHNDLHTQSECYKIVYGLKNEWVRDQVPIENLIGGINMRSPSQVVSTIIETYKHVCANGC